MHLRIMSGQENREPSSLVQRGLTNGSTNVILDWDPSVQFHGTVHTATLAVCTVLVIFVVILGTFGNGLVILSALQCRKLRSNFEVLVFNLAGADLIICLCLSPTFLFLLFSDPPSPREFCGGYLFATTTCGLLSLLTLVAIAAHRQSWLKGRVKGSLSTLKTAFIIGAVYTVGVGTAVGGTLHVTVAWSDTYTDCRYVMNSSDVKSNNVVLFFISPVVIVSIIIIVTSYSAVAKAVRVQTYLRVKSLQPLLKPAFYKPIQSPSNADTSTSAPEVQQSILENTSGKKLSSLRHCSCCNCMAALDKENKAVTMCLLVILIISLCWTPLVVSHFIELISGQSIIVYQVKLCGIALIFLNSALNPYMYAQGNGRSKQRYGRFLWDMVRCDCRIPKSRRFITLNAKTADLKTVQSSRKHQNSIVSQKCPDKALPPAHTKEKCNKLLKTTYTNNILLYGDVHSSIPVRTKEDWRQTKKTLAQTIIISDVKTLVHKSCCHRHAPDDQSLIDS
uniref:G-protein coupled receptors family 1 profile domain-containing protein n=1 Tax=Biomphalaria glabrata TaxID=6526 RepID=A0A2C9LSH7_BIOGL